jgi:hypothetical protein
VVGRKLRKSATPKWTSAAAVRLRASAGDSALSIEQAVEIVVARLINELVYPPTPLEDVARRLGVTLSFEEDLPISGELRREGESLRIVCSKSLNPGRARFTIAHEIGHAFFETSGPRPPRHGKELERLCDMIATEILMPRAVFQAAMSTPLTLAKVRDLSQSFGASLTATAIRCAELSGATALEMDADGLVWSYGVGRIAAASVRESLTDIGVLGRIEKVVRIPWNRTWNGEWRLEGRAIGSSDRALVLLVPLRGVLDEEAS